MKEAGHILLEGAPRGFDRREVASRLSALEGVVRVDHIHAWSVTQERPVATLEITVDPDANALAVKQAAKALLHDDFGIEHSTVELHLDDGTPRRPTC